MVVTYNNVTVFQTGGATWTTLGADTSLQAAARDTATSVVSVADQVGQNVASATGDSGDGTAVAQVVRDCTKIGLDTTAWDLWWGATYGQVFSPDQELLGTISSCLQTYAGADYAIADSLANTLVYYIDIGANRALTVNYDAAELANWLQGVNYYYVPY